MYIYIHACIYVYMYMMLCIYASMCIGAHVHISATALAAEGVSCGQGLLPKNSLLLLSQELPPMERPLPGRDSLGVPPWNTPWESLPGRDPLGEIPWERLSGKNLLGPGHPPGEISQNGLRDFLSRFFSACFLNRSGTPLFRSWHRKTFQNGAQTLPKSSPKRVRNRSYVANTEK